MCESNKGAQHGGPVCSCMRALPCWLWLGETLLLDFNGDAPFRLSWVGRGAAEDGR